MSKRRKGLSEEQIRFCFDEDDDDLPLILIGDKGETDGTVESGEVRTRIWYSIFSLLTRETRVVTIHRS